MVYNKEMDTKLESLVSKWDNMSKKMMFGGTGYLLFGNMVAGIYKDYYILRVGKEHEKEALESSKFKPLDITGRPMSGWVMAKGTNFSDDTELSKWLMIAKDFVKNLPKK